jgi:hypothetical protein
VAAPYTTAATVRSQVPPLVNPDNFSDELLDSYIAEFEGICEEYRGVAFTPRDTSETVLLGRSGAVLLTWPQVRSIASVTVDGTALTPEQYEADLSGRIFGLAGKRAVVAYSHGFDPPPAPPYGPAVVRATVQYVRAVALADQSNVGRDVIAQTYEGMTLRYSTPDKRAGRPTGFVEVDRLLNSLPDYRIPGIG